MTDQTAVAIGAAVSADDDGISVVSTHYRWAWARATDRFEVRDARGHVALAGPLQPAVVVSSAAGLRSAPGAAGLADIRGNVVRVHYTDVNESADIVVTLRFEERCWHVEPFDYAGDQADAVVSATLFARPDQTGVRPLPGLECTYLVQPGLSMAAALSSVVGTDTGLNLTSWLGRGSLSAGSVSQQWGLPVHYFAGLTRSTAHNVARSRTTAQSDAFCCGLTALPDADMMLEQANGRVSPLLKVRDDLWGEPAAGVRRLGAALVFTLEADYREAIRAYYDRAAVAPQLVTDPQVAPGRARTLAMAQFNTWGAQCAGERTSGRFDQFALEEIYDGMRAARLRPGLFVIDDKWEGNYGQLEHDPERFPTFEQFLDRVRADGYGIGLWAAFLRTNDPAAVGLGPEHLMCDRFGRPIVRHTLFSPEPYFLLDPTHPHVGQVLSGLIERFVHRYDPDLVKFDFGYELPDLGQARCFDRDFSGERLLHRALEVVVGALRAAKPDIAVMYYSLSPLLLPFLDQHSHDDEYLAVDDYDYENNQRGFFSGLLAERGVSVYPSSGYDWRTAPQIWFDSAVLGPVGSLHALDADEHDDGPDAAHSALFNGFAALSRPPAPCRIDPLSPVSVGGIRGARSLSWLRYENELLVTAAVRRQDHHSLPPGCPVEIDGDIVVTALAPGGLATSNRIGIVGLGSGRLGLHHDAAASARATAHCADGTASDLPMDRSTADWIRLPVHRSVGGVPVEWIEITFNREEGRQ